MIPLRDTIPSRRVPVATIMIIIINIMVFFNQILLPYDEAMDMIYRYAFIPTRFVDGLLNIESYIPLLSSMFLHGSFIHILSNMWIMWLFGDNVEDKMGFFRFILFYLLSGLIAGFAHFVFNPLSNMPTVGASGAIAGVMGAYFLMFPHSKILTLIPFIPFFIRVPAPIFLFIWFIGQLHSGVVGVVEGVAWWAHIFGFLAGILLHKKFIKARNYRRR